ncbi:general odorant-binding protein 69a-like isoform X1 [Anoplophora glabripennis]|uniref:general odorant-binding protein 69a-like isoform X1 n=1 Tax=Anoplophora glabripennis TaxID=217634 RepID=UPI0008743644|nr:general odorant-binding protein 69a-like isoform X1 [Anoplophora glabripennis]
MNLSVTLLYVLFCLTSIKGLSESKFIAAKAEARAACLASTGVSEDLVMDINRDGKFADDENLKCYVKCVHEYLGLMAEDGTMDYEKLIENIPEEFRIKYASRIRACGTIYGSDVCDTAWLTIKCYGENIPKLPHP